MNETRSFPKTNSGQTPQGKLNQQKHPVDFCCVCALFVFAGIVASSMALFGVDGTPLRDSESLTSYPLVSNGATLMISGPRPVNKHTHARRHIYDMTHAVLQWYSAAHIVDSLLEDTCSCTILCIKCVRCFSKRELTLEFACWIGYHSQVGKPDPPPPPPKPMADSVATVRTVQYFAVAVLSA